MLPQLLTTLSESLNSQLVGGGLILLLSGAGLAALRFVPAAVWRLVSRQLIITMDVVDNDTSFQWLRAWLDQQPYSRKSRAVSLMSHYTGDDAHPQFTPAPGLHWFWYRRRLILLRRTREQKQNGNPMETFELRMLGRSPAILRELVAEARAAFDEPTNDVSVYISRQDFWKKVSQFTPRPLSTVILPCGLSEDLQRDVRTFLASRAWYDERGVPWRRGYLFHGPPGSGKSSLIGALAGEVGMNLFILNLTGGGLTDESLLNLLLSMPKKSALLLEDFDTVADGRNVQNGEGLSASTVTFSGVLNALDGVATRPGQVVFMTTNHRDKLDPALIRPGRVDREVYLGLPDADQARRLFRSFHPEAEESLAQGFAAAAVARGLSMAELQHTLLMHRDDPEACLAACHKMLAVA